MSFKSNSFGERDLSLMSVTVSTIRLNRRSCHAEFLAQVAKDGRRNAMRNINSRAFAHNIRLKQTVFIYVQVTSTMSITLQNVLQINTKKGIHIPN
jgi:hypothetical protein